VLNRVIRFALTYRPLIVVASLVALVYGGYVTTQLPIDVFPDLDRPRVVVMTEAPGLAPEDVETLITFPLETALLGATGVQAVRSQSGVGLSVVYVEFDWDMNIHLARQTVQERLGTVTQSLPSGVRPHMAPISSIMGQILHLGLTRSAEGEAAQMELRTLADWVIRPRLLKIPGVAQVVVMGGGRKQYQVLLNPNALLEHGVTLQEVETALRNNNLNASGGFHVQGDKEQAIRVLGRLGTTPAATLDQIAAIPVKHVGGRAVQVRHVGRVVEAPQLKRGDASVNGQLAVMLMVTKQPHVDTRHLTDEVKTAMTELQTSLPRDVTVHVELFQLKRFIDTGIYNVAEALAIGGVLIVIILFLFLLNFRTTFISLTAIPLSLALTALTFQFIGWVTGTPLSLNVMTLGGIAVALGELVDDSIVDVENIFRRLKENAQLPEPRPALKVVYEASIEIRGAIVFGTIMVILVFIPLFALSGIEGRLFTPLSMAYIISILASLLVSLTLTPVLAYYLLPSSRAARTGHDSPLLRALKWAASGLIRLSLGWAGTLLLITWLLVGASFWILTQLGADFLPPFDEGSVQVNLSLPPGSSLIESNQVSRMADGVFRKLQASDDHPLRPVLAFTRRTGRAELDEHVEPVSNTEYILTINPRSDQHRDEVIQTILAELKDGIPGVQAEVEQPLAHLISHMLSGVTAQIAIKIYGDDLDALRRAAELAKARMADIPGVASLAIEAQQQVEEVHIRLKPEQLTYYGLDRQYVAEFISTALRGEALTEVFEGQRRFELIIWLDEQFRKDLGSLGRLRLTLPGGRGEVPLAELAEVTQGAGPNAINRENARRRIVLRCNALGRDLASVVADIQDRLRTVQADSSWPAGYFIEYGGQFESQRRATILIAILAGVAFVGMFLVLYMLYPSARVVLQVLNAIPAAFIGGVLALALTGQTLTVASMVGFISLGGIAARNGILLVSHYFHLMKHEGEGFTESMIMRGSLERLAPVLMTALTAGIGLIPLVVEGHRPGREILYPVATVILGGLITSTLCEYLLHPGLFWRFSGKDAIRLVEHSEPKLGRGFETSKAT
jgi:HME family heavy-metal exporter